MPVISFTFGIVITDDALTLHNINKGILIAVRFILRRIYPSHLNLYNVACVILPALYMSDKNALH